MCAVAIDAEHAAIYLASEVDIAIGVGMVELVLEEGAIVEYHISDSRVASIWAVLPAGVG
jgi:hypothetical protein